ncbi:MAG: flagellar hook-basal body complex protein, partial [Planctomycetota bacterium]
MPHGLYLSAAGAAAQSQRLETISHNLANVSTPGFKTQHSILKARFASLIEGENVAQGQGGIDDVGGGVEVQGTQTQFDLGPMRRTGNRTDFALHDANTFFVV